MLGPELQFVDREYVWFEGKRLLYLAGIDYHRMSNDPLIVKTAAEAAAQYGLNPTGSRTTTGNHSLYARLESVVSEFFASEAAVVGPSGYLSNTIVLQAIESEYGALFIDEKAHSSLVDAAHQSGKRTYRFTHLDAHRLEEQLVLYLRVGPRNIRSVLLDDGELGHGLLQQLPAAPRGVWELLRGTLQPHTLLTGPFLLPPPVTRDSAGAAIPHTGALRIPDIPNRENEADRGDCGDASNSVPDEPRLVRHRRARGAAAPAVADATGRRTGVAHRRRALPHVVVADVQVRDRPATLTAATPNDRGAASAAAPR